MTCGAKAQKLKEGAVYLTAEEVLELLDALEEAVYLLSPTDEDMQKKEGVYRIVTALEKLKEKNTMIGDHDKYLYEGVATASSLLPDTIHFYHTMNSDTEVMRITKDGIWVNPDLPVDDVAKAVLDALDSQIKVLVQSAIEAKLKEKNT